MKKNFLFLLAMLAGVTLSFGKAISVNTAKTIGYNYLHQKGGSLKSADDLSLVYTSGTASTARFYVFSGSSSFVLVAADDAVTPILGYSTEGAFITDHISKNITGFFEDYNKQIDYVISNNVAASPEITTKWDNILNNKNSGAAARTTDVAPLLGTIRWDQYPNYNADCPSDAGAASYGGRDVTGCVATAMAQVMKFWSWPAHGVGLHSYATASYGSLSANFGATTYNWSAMPNSITSANPDVATLMYQCGVSVEMDYTPSESGSFVVSSATGTPPYCAEYALKNFFNYTSSLHGEQRSGYSDATWISMLQSDLNAGHPVIYSGTGTSGGHCFVFDGYTTSGSFFHVNWGWSGADNGNFTIDALNPSVLGAGGGAGGFNSDQAAIFGVKPNGTSPGGGGVATDSLQLYDFVTLSAASIPYISPVTVSTNVYNYSVANDFTGDFGALAFDASGAFVGVIDSLIGESLPAGDVFGSSGVPSDITFSTTGMVSMVPGNYTIGIYYRHTGGSWIAVSDAVPYTNFPPINVYNIAPLQLYTAMTAAPSPLVQGSAASFTLRVYNNSGTPCNDSLYLGIYNMDGTNNCDIQYLPGTSLGAFAASGTLTFSTTAVAATPGTYLLVLWYKDPTYGWGLAGTGPFSNPMYINVVAPPLSPDIYEVNNTAATAYNLTSTPLTWTSNVSSVSTPGSNFHVVTDEDYYKIVLPAGYHYTIKARINDLVSKDDGIAYTVDAVWSYSTDGGTTWSAVYDDVMTGTPDSIYVGGTAGGTVLFHVSAHNAGNMGTYLLKISSIKRGGSTSIPEVNLEAVKIFPNPASDVITVDLSGTGANGTHVALFDVQGKNVYSAELNGRRAATIPVNSIASGTYFVQLSTDAGVINKKIVVSR